MSRAVRYLTLTGQFESGVLGHFRIVRGFADLKTLAAISVPYEMVDAQSAGQVEGQQRQIDPDHAKRIKCYLENGDQRFMPEVILSLRHEVEEVVSPTQQPIAVKSVNSDDGITVGRPWTSPKIRVHRVTIDRQRLDEIRARRLIRRVDGNHRLMLADTLETDSSVPTKYLASFCIVLLGAAGNAADDYSESLIFHTINSTALPLESEHALKLIMGQHPDYDMKPDKEFAYSPDLHFTRLLRDGVMKLPEPVQTRLGNRPLTSLRGAVRGNGLATGGAAVQREVKRKEDGPAVGSMTRCPIRAPVDRCGGPRRDHCVGMYSGKPPNSRENMFESQSCAL